MIVTVTQTPEKRIVLLGITDENILRMKRGQPVYVRAESHSGFPEDLSIAIIYGATEDEITKQLEDFIGPKTQMINIPRTKGEPQ